jgi:hypothetical protein
MWRLVNPFESAVAFAAAIIGAAGLAGHGTPSSTLAAVWPGGQVAIYFTLLLLGGIFTLIGIGITLYRRTRAGSLVWRSGLTAISAAWGIYGVALLWAGTGPTAALLLLTLTVAALIRIVQLSRTKSP